MTELHELPSTYMGLLDSPQVNKKTLSYITSKQRKLKLSYITAEQSQLKLPYIHNNRTGMDSYRTTLSQR